MAQSQRGLPSRSCRCLNVRMWPQLHTETPPDFLMATASDSDYTLAYIGDRGVSIIHPQVTVRTRKRGPAIADANRCVRFTTLTCLLCQTLAYRVQQLVASDVDVQEGPLLPSPDWVEQEALLSSCGWIEVHKDCLLTEDVTRLSSSSTYSPIFDIALPQNANSPATPTHSSDESPKESCAQASPALGPFLYSLKPLFPPAPFIPSHPVFVHLSSIAANASERLKSSAEEQITTIVRDKLAELEKANDELRHNVEELWRKFVENVGELAKQTGPKFPETRGRDSSRGLSSPTTGVSGPPIISIRNFAPVPSIGPRMLSPSSSLPRVSSLSVSLATSGFHHVRVDQEPVEVRVRSSSDSPRLPPPYSSHPSSLGSAEGPISLSSESSPELSPLMNGDSIVQPFRRSMDQTRDTAVSFRYFTILEADVARARQLQATSQPSIRDEDAAKGGEPGPPKERGDPGTAKATSPVKETEDTHVHPTENSDRDVKSLTPQRRKVKFDIKAEAAAGEEASPAINGESRVHQELIFDLEDATDTGSSDAAPTLPFVENAQVRLRGRHRVASAALPELLSSLRPTTLPAYSPLQPKPTEELVTGAISSVTSHASSRAVQTEYPEQLDPQEEEILKLVAANTPSHRNAWKRNSKAWKLFVSRRRNGVPGALIPEEIVDGSGKVANDSDDGEWGGSRDIRWSLEPAGFPASLPIDISPLSHRREPLSLASYQPKTSLSDRAGTKVPAFLGGQHTSSAIFRRASYAERDRSRAMDPGTLDFIVAEGEEVEEDESGEEPNQTNVTDEARGRQRALKILEARSKIPEAGMWMSLA